jgi:hypothetical protein
MDDLLVEVLAATLIGLVEAVIVRVSRLAFAELV